MAQNLFYSNLCTQKTTNVTVIFFKFASFDIFKMNMECAGDCKSFIKGHNYDRKIQGKRFILKVY